MRLRETYLGRLLSSKELLRPLLHKVLIKLNLSFANDRLSCKWVYAIDLDTKVFDVFGGAEEKMPGYRFRNGGGHGDSVPSFVFSSSFSELQEMKGENKISAPASCPPRAEAATGIPKSRSHRAHEGPLRSLEWFWAAPAATFFRTHQHFFPSSSSY